MTGENVWLGIALHTTPEIPRHMAPEVRAVILGVETDVLGLDLNQMARPETTFGTMDDDVLAHFDPSFERKNLVEMIQNSAWPE